MTECIEREWLEFRKAHYPDDLPDIVMSDMRDVFFCGAVGLFNSINQKAFSIQKIHDELTRFLREKQEKSSKKSN